MFRIDPRVFVTNGGGNTSVEGASKYFYLIARDVGGLETVDKYFSDGKSGLYRLAANAGNVLAFAVIDIAASESLRNNLQFSDEAKDLYAKIEAGVPCMVTSSTKLADPEGVKSASIFTLHNFDQDFHRFQVEMRLIRLGTRKALIDTIRQLNEIITIRPNIPGIGVGFDGNKAITKYLDSIDLKK